MAGMTEWSRKPLKLRLNRVWRTYRGGLLLEQWQGLARPQDSDCPEEWVASLVRARNAGREHLVEGLSVIDSADGSDMTLIEAIESAPEGFLGRRHVSAYGSTTGVFDENIGFGGTADDPSASGPSDGEGAVRLRLRQDRGLVHYRRQGDRRRSALRLIRL
ncbi:hypothetical protein [Paenibacillus gyeongsangnamensis]|uniref:hypothetical protein n=1 Tax=Paenibacillus gyeongsangnamensis TaxID=3388067 RepID=UPI002FCF63BE